MKRGPHFSADEYARLAEVIVDGHVRSAIGVLVQGPDRQGLETGAQDGFWTILEKYNNPNFFPMNSLGEIEPAVRELVPGKGHTREYGMLYRMWNLAKPIITKAKQNYGVSGQNNPDKSAYVPNLGILYLWVRLEQAKLDSAVLKTVPDGVGQEDGSGGAPSTADKRPKRVKKVVNETPATPQPAPAETLAAATLALVANMAQDMPKATATSEPAPRNHTIKLSLDTINSNADAKSKAMANRMLQQALLKQAAEDDIIVIDDDE